MKTQQRNCWIKALWLGSTLLLTTPAFSQWTQDTHGPYGGNIIDIIVSPDPPHTLYAVPGTNQNFNIHPKTLLTSDNQGQQWLQHNTQIEGSEGSFYKLIVTPGNPQIHFSESSHGIAKSTDGGQTWHMTSVGIIQDLSLCPSNTSVLYAYSEFSNTLLKSIDTGESWQRSTSIADNFVPVYPVRLAITPNDCNSLYVIHGEKLWKTEDGAETWLQLDTSTLPDEVIFSEIATNSSGNALFVATKKHGVFRSTDAGGSWQSATQGIDPITIRTLTPDPLRENVWFAMAPQGVWKTVNNGDSWQVIAPELRAAVSQSLAIHPTNPDQIYMGTATGVFQSLDGGAHWAARNTGIQSPHIYNLYTVASGDSTTLYAATASGVSRLEAGHEQWQPLTEPVGSQPIKDLLVRDESIWALANHEHQPDYYNFNIFDSAFNSLPLFGAIPTQPTRLFHSIDAGQQWDSLSFMPSLATTFSTLSVSLLNPDTVYLGGTQTQIDQAFNALTPASSRIIYFSTNTGTTWQPVFTDNTQYPWSIGSFDVKITPNPYNPSMLYTGTSYSFNQAGKNEFALLNGIPFFKRQRVVIAVDPFAPSRQYAGINLGRNNVSAFGGLYISEDGGQHWHASGLKSLGVYAIQIDPNDRNTLYAIYGGGVAKSTDAGESWIKFNKGLELQGISMLKGLAIQDDTLYVSTQSGLYSCKRNSCVSNRSTTTSTVVEFYNTQLKHYFLTESSFEASILDRSSHGWERTGETFKTWVTPQETPPSAVAICRFYSQKVNTHFFSLANEECAAVLKSPDWIWEGNRFYMLEPNREGICPANSEPVYRLYNNRYATHKDSNHRYTHDMKIVEEMQAQNWRFEGTAFCAPL